MTEWRKAARPENLDLIDFYGRYGLRGQFCGMGNAMHLGNVRTAMEIDGIPAEAQADLAQRLILLHSIVLEMTEE